MRPNFLYAASKPARWADHEVKLQVCTRRREGECVKVGGGAERSIMTILWEGLREERRRAVASPMPEEPPVMTMVLGVDLRLVKVEASGWKRDMLDLGCEELRRRSYSCSTLKGLWVRQAP